MIEQTWKPIDIDADLPTINTEESEHLDFKAEAWPSTDDGAREIARDVAQFANHLGGSIIVGAIEDGSDRLTGYVTVPESTKVVQRVADVCHAALSPRIDLRHVVIKTKDSKDVVVFNISAYAGVVAIRLKGMERWEFYKRDGKSKRPVSFGEVEQMWTQGRRGKLILLRVPVVPTQDQTRMAIIDAKAGDAAFLREPARFTLHDDHFQVTLHNSKSFGLPYEFVRAAWPNADGQWIVSLTAKFELIDSATRLIVGYSP